MGSKTMMIWFSVVSCILILIGLIFSTFGFGFFPQSILPRSVILPWVSSIYGAVMIGWGLTLLLIGRLAFRRKDYELMKMMLMGIATWLMIEAIYSAFIGVFFNVGVDFVVLVLLGAPLVISIRKNNPK